MSRYLQQIIVPEVGLIGQQKLESSKVLVIGLGGLGTPLTTYLASAGIGHLGLVDGDVVSTSNLHRQFQFNEKDVGEMKSKVLKDRLLNQNPTVNIDTYTDYLSVQSALELVAKYDVICDCTDDVETRLLIDAVCAKLNRPLVYAAVRGWEGYLTVLHHKKGISLTDIFTEKELRLEAQNDCSTAGIVGTICGILGSWQANEVLKLCLGLDKVLDGKILCVDGLSNQIRKLKLR